MTEDFIVRDFRSKQFFMIDDEYLNGYAKLCGINATGVYMSLCRHASKNQKSFPSIRLISEQLSISERTVQRALAKLKEWNIIKVEKQVRQNGSQTTNTYILMDKSQWIKKDQTPPVTVTPTVTQSPLGVSHSHPHKETHSKETYIYTVILDFWNYQKIVVHRKLTDSIKRKINSKIKEGYTEKDIKNAIKNYSYILKSKDHYWSYSWTLQDFLQRGFEKFIDLEIAKSNYSSKKQKTTQDFENSDISKYEGI